MISEWRRKTKVKAGGQVEVSLPELRPDELVEVVIRRDTQSESNGKRPGFGSARGQINMRDDFDAPLADFCDYQSCIDAVAAPPGRAGAGCQGVSLPGRESCFLTFCFFPPEGGRRCSNEAHSPYGRKRN